MSQSYLDIISSWTKENKMKINSAKKKSMVFNFTNNYQFGTRLKIDNQIIKTISETKLLGTSDLKWTQNTSHIVKKAYARMELIRKLSSFGALMSDLKQVYIAFIRSLCEHSSWVWHSSLTLQNEEDLERVQKVALRII